jgi:predicted AlkP superfamily pyrophosphatase or phosphodiesterase
VLVIGIDGARSDCLLVANTPNIDSLWRNAAGAYRFDAITDKITVSGPAWTTMLSGISSDRHGVKGNKQDDKGVFVGYQPACKTFLNRLEDFNPQLYTASLSQWAPINGLMGENVDYQTSGKSEVEIRDKTVELLKTKNPDAIFIQLDDVDGAGHKSGYDPGNDTYIKAIETADAHIGEILKAVRARPTYQEENWLVIVSTDHGGRKKSHGGNSNEEKTVFFIANGPSIQPGELSQGVITADVAATALAHMGVPIDPEWKLEGKARGLKQK